MAKPCLFVLDTCVLISNPLAFEDFPGSEVVIPITVLDELDHLKTQNTVAGKQARIAIRNLDKICQQGEISKGIKLENGSLLKVDTSSYQLVEGQGPVMDNRILACALKLQKEKKKMEIVLVSLDINMRIRGESFGLKTQSYTKEANTTDELYSGLLEKTDIKVGTALAEQNMLDLKSVKWASELSENQFVHLKGEGGRSLAIGRRVGNKLKKIHDSRKVWGLEPRSLEQACALNLLLDPTLPLVSLVGVAGTGKTTLALAAALEQVLEKKQYARIVLYKPMQVVEGQDIGYLPGSILEKLSGAYQSYMDSFEFLLGRNSKGQPWMPKLEMYMEKGIIQMEAMAFLRGKNFGVPTLVICDECQNFSVKTAKTLLTRLGENSKIVMLGDYEQSDTNLDYSNSALTNVIEKFKSYDIAGHMTLTKCERGALATLAGEIL